ncbi:acyl-CoA dehydrogenase family protein [Ponticaulis sp.]|uniref:acyl-CoA dehydrogenase family protein n=1 Tax=Ponticaulis sp. TaxID=2020902 RepID=UPI000B767796|nr:acyl-CoA dehydrogenase family protein [Ponticaulis sp.]MAJ07514.1 acyl-CoA dehydrogenase [Ponticaulis sp.]RPG17745.1 MAG: acyl-CoA dehydrogenase [Hyphomonadaceae bacterium TMED125]|tara:strand:+ start:749 stop:1885 length:1137 start_codon:yes stop_codon:yes gene_type:complete
MTILTEEQSLISGTAAKFTADMLRPNSARWEEERTLDRSVLEALGELGFGGIYLTEDLGGSGLSRFDAVLIFEQLSKGDISHATFLSIHNMAGAMIDKFASEELRQHYIPKFASCELIASYCLTEPGSGSDAASLRTRAVRDGDDYVLNGSKMFISGAGFSDVYVVMARTSDDGARGISTFIVEKGTEGLSFGKKEEKMGWHAQPTAVVSFDNCRIPAKNRVGNEGDGFKYAMAGLDGGRLNIAAASLGGAQEALERALAYAKDRKQFGKAIADFQATQFKLADMDIELSAARALLYTAAQKLDAGASDASKACASAKRFVTDTGFKVANDALQIHGGYGYLREYEVERIVRDLRVHQILEGTNEIMRVIVSRDLLKD